MSSIFFEREKYVSPITSCSFRDGLGIAILGNDNDNGNVNSNDNKDIYDNEMYYCHDIHVSTCECTFRNCDYPKYHRSAKMQETQKGNDKPIIEHINTDKLITKYIRTQDKLIHQQIVSLLGKLDGQFSFILHDKISGMVLVARDPFGITQCCTYSPIVPSLAKLARLPTEVGLPI